MQNSRCRGGASASSSNRAAASAGGVDRMSIARGISKTADGKIAGLYDLEETIGKGHYAVVKLARHVFTGERVAVKVIDKTKLDEVSRAHLFQEVRCMKLVQHPNVVRLYEVIDTQTRLYLILEWGDGGDMYDHIMKHERGLSENVAREYFTQIVHAINYCHQLHVVHRDLKPENVVFFEKAGMCKLTDFGFSNKFTPGRKLDTSCGSLAYSAPEILLGDSYDAPAVDIWSLGVILYMLVCGEAPFREANDSETLTMIMDCRYTLPSHISLPCHDMIKSMLVREPSDRASLEDIISHPWMRDGGGAKCLQQPLVQMPLARTETLSLDDHNYVIQRMVDGCIASKEDILLAIKERSYNHVTATYYLLAERLLRRRGDSNVETTSSDQQVALSPLALSPRVRVTDADGINEHEKYNNRQWSPFDSLVSPPGLHPSIILSPSVVSTPLNLSPGFCSSPIRSGHTSPRVDKYSPGRSASGGGSLSTGALTVPHSLPRVESDQSFRSAPRCALIHEDSAEGRPDDDDENSINYGVTNIHVSLSATSLSAAAERRIAPSNEPQTFIEFSTQQASTLPVAPKRSTSECSNAASAGRLNPSLSRPLYSACSSPQLLNEIFEECESDEDDDDMNSLVLSVGPHSSRAPRSSAIHFVASPEVLRKFERLHHHGGKKRLVGGGSGSVKGGRAPSCSSSDTSDTDEVDPAARKQKEKTKANIVHKSKLVRRDSSEHSSDTDGPTGQGGSSGCSGAGSASHPPQNERGGRQNNDEDKHTDGNHEERHSSQKTSHNAKENALNVDYEGTLDAVPVASQVSIMANEREGLSVKSGCQLNSIRSNTYIPGMFTNLPENKSSTENHDIFGCKTMTSNEGYGVSKEFTSTLNHLNNTHRASDIKAATITEKNLAAKFIHFRSTNIVDLIDKFNLSNNLNSTDDQSRMQAAIESNKLVPKPCMFNKGKHCLYDMHANLKHVNKFNHAKKGVVHK